MKLPLLALGLLFAAVPASAQRSVDALLVETSAGPYAAGDDYTVSLQLRSPQADGGVRDVRDASVFITFDPAALELAGYAFDAYSGRQASYAGGDAYYQEGTVLEAEAGLVSVNVANDFRSTEVGRGLDADYGDVVEITFTVLDPSRDPDFGDDLVEVFYTDPASFDPVQYDGGSFDVETAEPAAPTVALSATPLRVGEDGGVSTVTATLSHATTAPVEVALAFGGTAAPADYVASAVTVTIDAGQTSGAVTVTGADDGAVEDDETVEVSIDGATNADPDGGPVAITLRDDDTASVTVAALADAAEGGADGAFTISLDQALGADLEVAFAVSGDAGDVAALGTTATISAGATSVEVAVSALDDGLVEDDESVTLTLASTNSARAVVGAADAATVAVLDNDTATVTVAASAQAAEGGSDGAFTITSSAAAAFDVALTLEVGGTATAGDDYGAIGTSVVLEAGRTSVEVSVEVADDGDFEGDETVTLRLASTDAVAVTVGTPALATVTIEDDDEARIAVSETSVAVSEAGTTATFHVSLPRAPTADVTIAVASSDAGEATVSTAALTFTPGGPLAQSVTVTGVDDGLDDGDQSVTVVLEAAASVDANFDGVDPRDVAATVADDDDAPTVTLAAAGSVVEGASTPITATLTGATTVADVTVSLAATGDASRFSVPDQIVIPAGQASASVPFAAPDRTGDQADLEVVVAVSAVAGATEATEQSVAITVQDDDPTLVTLSASPTTISEAGGASTVTATLTTPAPSAVTVALGFSTDGAEPADYTASATEITVAPGATTGTATVTAVADGVEGEGDETLTVSITTVTGGDAVDGTREDGDQSVELTIRETAPVATVDFARAQTSVGEGAGSVTLGLVLDRGLEAPATVVVRVQSGDPADLDGVDAVEVTVPPSTTAASVTFPVTDDQQVEPNEVFVLGLEVVAGALEAADGAQTAVVVADNDGRPVTVTVAMRDADGDGVEDGGPRFFSVPVGGLAAGDVAVAAGGPVSVVDPGTGGLVPADDDETVLAGQLVVVDVAPGAALSFTGSDPGAEIAQTHVVLEDGGDARVLVFVANLTAAPVPVGDLAVEGGSLADVALVFDEAGGTFRPVSLAGLAGSGLPPLSGLVLQVVPDAGRPAVAVSLAAAGRADGSADGSDVTRAPFVPTDGETAVAVALRSSTTAAADAAVLRLVEGAGPGLDRLDGAAVRTPGVDLAFDGGLPLAALSADPAAVEGGLDLALAAQAGPGSYEIAADVLGDRRLDVFLVDDGVAVRLAEPYTFTVAEGDDLGGRFVLRVAPRLSVAGEGAALEAEVGRVYPNPTATAAWLDLEVAAQTVRVEVFDLLGRAVARVFDGAHAGGALRLDLGVGALAPGAYVVRATGDSFTATRRLSVVR